MISSSKTHFVAFTLLLGIGSGLQPGCAAGNHLGEQAQSKSASDKPLPTAQDNDLGAKPVNLSSIDLSAQASVAEARLLQIYRMIGDSDTAKALGEAKKLVDDYPTFALAQLVYGDLLSARIRPLNDFGDVPTALRGAANQPLDDLRAESHLRLKALSERPPAGSVPSEFVRMPTSVRHAIAIDASRARLYLFENRASGPVLIADYYISIAKLGVAKTFEGDLRTPLGVYYITSSLDQKSLTDFYGAGALPINYPNVLDVKRGKTGGGIWLHGSPPGQFSRAPLASEGCVVLANPDLKRLINTVEVGKTPVVISNQLSWVSTPKAKAQSNQFEVNLVAWRKAKSSGNMAELVTFYAPDFSNRDGSLADWLPSLRRDVAKLKGREIQLKDLSLLHWQDNQETMVVTFGEVANGRRSGSTKRQYWSRQGNQWKIIYEGEMG